jgi:glucose/arabinose dehydrogenase
MRRKLLVVVALVTAALPWIAARPATAATPPLSVTPVVSGLDHPWDIGFAGDGTMFFTERAGRLSVRLVNGTVRQLAADLTDLWVAGETGLMGVEVDPAFSSNRRIYTCQGTTGGNLTVQVVAWAIDAGLTTATRVNDPLVGGIDGQSGFHGGCQLRVDGDGYLQIGTGDAAIGTNPQDLFSLAGKTLRVDRFSGAGVVGNPFIGGGGDARVYTYGHRNVQGLAVRPGTGEVWSAEHGPDINDEINRLVPGGNYGWDPVPGYNQATPMTDFDKFPGAIGARWSSGSPTIATSGATFLAGSQWKGAQGALAVSTLKGSQLRIFAFDASGDLVFQEVPPELDHTYGRLRGAETAPDGSLWLTTDNGGGADLILRVAPPSSSSSVFLRTTATPGPPQASFSYGNESYQHLLCDFDGDGKDGIVAFSGGSWFVRNTASGGAPDTVVSFGAPGYTAVCGNWDGVGGDGIGVFIDGTWYLRQTLSPGAPQVAFPYGTTGYVPVVGNWDGAGGDGIGVYVDGAWHLRQAPSAGAPDLSFAYGTTGYVPVVGNWDGAGSDGIGVFVLGQWHLRQTPTAGAPQLSYAFGGPGYRPLVGDHDGNGIDGSGVLLP